MSARAGLSDRAASVLDADPRLARSLSAHDALTVGHAAVLPVLAVPVGPWHPPSREALGDRACVLAVLSGLLMRDAAAVLGPGDLADPWTGDGEWVACTPVRLAVVGTAFADAIAPWPDVARVAARPRERQVALAGDTAGREARVLDLLWRVAARWGRPRAGGLALPAGLGVSALACLTALTERALRTVLEALEERGALARRREGAWVLLAPPHDSPARERLRAKVAEQCALARLTQEHTAALFEEIDDRRRDKLGNPDRFT